MEKARILLLFPSVLLLGCEPVCTAILNSGRDCIEFTLITNISQEGQCGSTFNLRRSIRVEYRTLAEDGTANSNWNRIRRANITTLRNGQYS